jgi:hypothetical protein
MEPSRTRTGDLLGAIQILRSLDGRPTAEVWLYAVALDDSTIER